MPAEKGGELYLFNANIPEYQAANAFNHEPRRPRKLLLQRREINRSLGAIQREGMTLVPLSIYFNERGIAKVQLGLAKGKRKTDKRDTEKERDWQRDKARLHAREALARASIGRSLTAAWPPARQHRTPHSFRNPGRSGRLVSSRDFVASRRCERLVPARP